MTALFAAALALLGVAAVGGTTPPAAAPPVQASYVYVRGADTLGFERITVTDTALMGELSLKGAPRISWSHRVSAGALRTLSLRAFQPGSADNAAPMQDAVVRVDADSAHFELTTGTRSQKLAMHTARDAVPLVNASVLHAALIAMRAARAGHDTVQFVLTSGAQTVPGLIARHGDTLVLTIAGAASNIIIAADGLPRSITVPSQDVHIVRGAAGNAGTTGTSGAATQSAAAVDYRAPDGAPYSASNVTIPTGRGYDLAATLTLPTRLPSGASAPKRAPVLVTISGSGPQERDSRLAIVPGYALFRDIADTLGRRGIATLRFDDRGVGASGGRESARTATSADFAEDVKSVIAWLKSQPGIDASRIALAGHSEGGMIAPMVADGAGDVRAIALLAGPGYTGRRVSMQQNREIIDASPLSAQQRDSIWRSVPAALDSVMKTSPWIGFFMTHDPLPTAKRVRQPVLILQGDTDHQVSPEQADTLAAAFRAGGNENVSLRHFPETNHLFLHDPSGVFTGYAALKDTHASRAMLGALTDWLVTTFKVAQ